MARNTTQHRRRRSSTVSFKSVKHAGMEGGETPSLKIAEYFVVSGLGHEPALYREPEIGDRAPICDIQIVLPLENELCPPDWEYITSPFTTYPANINWVNSSQCPVYIICKRGYEQKPICDIDIHFMERKEKVKPGFTYIKTSINGKPVSLNGHVNRPNKHIYLGYARALTSSFTMSVSEIHHVTHKREEKQGVRCIRLHKSAFTGDSFLTVQQEKLYATTGLYKETMIDRFPQTDNPQIPLQDRLPSFCLPMGVRIEWFRNRDEKPAPEFSTFVLTTEKATKLYGAALTFYELIIGEKTIATMSPNHPVGPDLHPYATKSICLVSQWPSFFGAFEKWLTALYSESVSGLALSIPIERWVSNMLFDVPFPTPVRPKVMMSIGDSDIQFNQPLTTQIPISGGTFSALVQCLEPDHVLDVFCQLLLEKEVLLLSSSPMKLTDTAEAFCSLLYPYKWVGVYVPLCPLSLGDYLEAPVPFIIGLNRDFLDLYYVPDTITIVDLDNNQVKIPPSNRLTSKALPKEAAEELRHTLLNIVHVHNGRVAGKELELALQDAFLRFQATVLKGYTNYLRPVVEQTNKSFCNAQTLFDTDSFIASRPVQQQPFYRQLMNTQLFTHYIENRSFSSDADESLEFFDECIERLDERGRLLYESRDMQKGQMVVVVPHPKTTALKNLYSYPVFTMDPSLFYEVKRTESTQDTPVISLRTKAEKQRMLKQASKAKSKSDTILWSRCLLQHVYCVWFLYLPSLLSLLEAGVDIKNQLEQALSIITTLGTERKTHLEEVCFRILISLAGFHEYPSIAVRTFQYRKDDLGLTFNAVTYGHYHRAVLDSNWTPSPSAGAKPWRTLRLYLTTVAAFKKYKSTAEVSSSLESIASSEKNKDSPSSDCKFTMCDSGIELDKPAAPSKTNTLDKNHKITGSNVVNTNDVKRGHARSVSDVTQMLGVQNSHERQFSDDAGSKTLRLRSPRFKRSSMIGKVVGSDAKGLTRTNSNSFRRTISNLRTGLTASSSTYSVSMSETEGDEPPCYNREYEAPLPVQFSLSEGTDMDPEGVMRVKMSSSFPCKKCNAIIYDEQIMSGWSEGESNLSTICPYCNEESVAQLSITIAYSNKEQDAKEEEKKSRPNRESTINSTRPVDPNSIQISVDADNGSESGNIAFAMPEPIRRERKTRSGSVLAAINPRSVTKQRDDDHLARVEVPYLSPIVLRKEVEYLLEHDGPAEMTSEDFPTSHSILFWNMVWWFCREQLSSALPLYVLYNFRNLHPNNKVCQSVVMSTQWCNSVHSLHHNFDELAQNKDLPHCKQLWRTVENFMQEDYQSACNVLLRHRTAAHANLYRELLFLGCAHKNSFNPLHFDKAYSDHVRKIPITLSENLTREDVPPRLSDQHCRQMFSWLSLPT